MSDMSSFSRHPSISAEQVAEKVNALEREIKERDHSLLNFAKRVQGDMSRLRQGLSRLHVDVDSLLMMGEEGIDNTRASKIADVAVRLLRTHDIVTPDQLEAVKNHGLTDDWIRRIEEMEREIDSPAGSFNQITTRVLRLEDSRTSTAILKGGYVFADESALQVWVATLNDPEINRLVPDFVSMFLLAEPKFETVAEGLKQTSDAVKANFSSLDLATIDLSYGITYPARILRKSEKIASMENDTVEWAPAFSSHTIFEGNFNNGTRHRLLRSIDGVRTAFEGGIDVIFPVKTNPKANAVFKDHVQTVATQCKEFLESCSPLYKKISGGGMADKEAWSRVLVFTKKIFDDVAKERAINSEGTMASKIWASYKATDMLKSYQHHTWVEHPKTLSIMALTSMQKEGKAINELTTQVGSHKSTIQKLTNELKQLKDEIKELKKKNPSLA